MKFQKEVVLKILDKYYTIASLGSLISLADWDLNTYMPEGSAEDRGFVLGKVNLLVKKLILDSELKELISKAKDNFEKLNDYEKGVIRVLEREIKIIEKLPDEFIEKWTKLTNEAQIIWRKAKEESNFELFRPYLEKIVELAKEKAEYLGYKEHPYDALIDLFEEGWTTKDFEKFFESIKEPLKSLFNKIKNSKNYIEKHPLEEEKYEKENMEKLNYYVLGILNFNPQKSRLDIAPHPFENAISLNDVRITTWYHEKDFRRSLTATIHEFGHSLYELQIDPELRFTPLQSGLSYAFHESQSRFWENVIGRNKVFLEKIFEKAKELLPFLNKYSFEDFVLYFNIVRPEKIRVEADEVTYHFHIILRFEIEKGLMEGSIKVEELPEFWKEKMKEYMDINVENDKEGVLQDIHWSMGAIGYFPTYSLGTFLSGLWLEILEKDLGNIDEILKDSDGILKIQEWLKENIHKYGKTYTPKEMILKVYGREFSVEPFLNYLNSIYGKIYNI